MFNTAFVLSLKTGGSSVKYPSDGLVFSIFIFISAIPINS